MYQPALSGEEEEILKSHFQKSPIQLVRLKAQAIVMRNDGLPTDLVCKYLYRDERSIQRWLCSFEEKRLSSLFSGQVSNENASKLTREQKKEIKKTLKSQPSEYGLPKEFWDVPQLKEYVRAEFGVEYESRQSYHYILKFCGMSFKYPDTKSPRRDETAISQQLKEVHVEINKLKKKGYKVYASDETRLQHAAEIRRAWLRKGERTIVKTERSREHQNYLGFLDQDNGACDLYEIERGNQEEAIRVLTNLLEKHPEEKVCIVWDNARWHKGKLLREELKKGKKLDRLHLINFPPYAPETNPIEHVWGWAKQQVSNRSQRDFRFLKEEFEAHINSRNFDYKI
jgi:transposase